MCHFVDNTEPDDGLAPRSARTSAGKTMTMFVSHRRPWLAPEELIWVWCRIYIFIYIPVMEQYVVKQGNHALWKVTKGRTTCIAVLLYKITNYIAPTGLKGTHR